MRHAEESLRLVDLRLKAGDALPADLMRARAALANRQEALLLAVNRFYQASLSLTVTLHLDPVVTLVPGPDRISQIALVREGLSIDELLAMALQYRPDLEAARTMLAAVEADKGGALWGALGPQLQAAYTFGSLKTDAQGQSFGPDRVQRGGAGAGFVLGLSTFGQVKTADSNVRGAALEVERKIDHVRAEVVSAQQEAIAHAGVIPIAREELDAAEESLRLAQASLNSGTMLLVDVLQTESALYAARSHYADAVVRYNQAQVNLLAALGLLNEQTLGAATGATAHAATLPQDGGAPAPLPDKLDPTQNHPGEPEGSGN
jgi:outer membrane protein TolC